MKKIKKCRILAIFLIAISARMAYSLFGWGKVIGLDGEWYNQVAGSLLRGEGFAVAGVKTAYTVPLYPIFLAGIYRIFGFEPQWVYLAQGFIGAFSCVLLYLIAQEIFDEGAAFLSGLISALYYFFIKCESMILTEAIFMPLFTLSIYLLMKMVKNRNLLRISLCALSFSLATLVRSVLFLFPFLLVGLDLLLNAKIFGERPCIRKIINITVFLTVFLLPIGIWTSRNYVVYKTFIPLATESGHVFYFSYHPKDDKIFGIAQPDSTSKEILKNHSEPEQSRLFMKAALNDIRKNPLKVIKYTVLKNIFFWSIFDWEILGLNGVYNFSTAFIAPFFLIGMLWIFYSKNKKAVLLLATPIIYTYSMSIVFMGLPRNRYTIEQFMIIMAAFAIIALYNRIRRKGLYLIAVGSWLSLNIYLFCNSIVAKEWFKVFFKSMNLW